MIRQISTFKVGNACHRDLTGVMNNSDFGGIEITTRDGFTVYIPKSGICKDGRIKKSWLKNLDNAIWLNAKAA